MCQETSRDLSGRRHGPRATPLVPVRLFFSFPDCFSPLEHPLSLEASGPGTTVTLKFPISPWTHNVW